MIFITESFWRPLKLCSQGKCLTLVQAREKNIVLKTDVSLPKSASDQSATNQEALRLYFPSRGPVQRPQRPLPDPVSNSLRLPPSIYRESRPASQRPGSARNFFSFGALWEEELPRQETRQTGARVGRVGLSRGWPRRKERATRPRDQGAGTPALGLDRGVADLRGQPGDPGGPRGRAARCSPGTVVIPDAATGSARFDPGHIPSLGAGPPQPRMEARSRTHLGNHFARHDSGLPSAPLGMRQISGSVSRGAAAPAVCSPAAPFELSRPATVEAPPSTIYTNPEEAFYMRPRPVSVLPITKRLGQPYKYTTL